VKRALPASKSKSGGEGWKDGRARRGAAVKPTTHPMLAYARQRLGAAFREDVKAAIVRSPNGSQAIEVLIAPEIPSAGVTSYGTMGLASYPMYQDGLEFPVRLELVAAFYSETRRGADLLGVPAFHIMQRGWLCSPGSILQNAIDVLGVSTTMMHLLFAPPFLWPDLATSATISTGNRVAWLQAIPISDAEYVYSQQHGTASLEVLFEARQIDVFDVNRKSVV
jgi:antitoxin YqcF